MNKKIRLLIIFAAVLLTALLYFFVDARNENNLLPRCMFNSLTGLYCPGCGSQRALSAMLHGDFADALHYNLLMMISLPFIIYSAIIFIINTFRQKQIVQKFFYSAGFAKIFFIAVIIFWVIRNIPFYPFNLLAPRG
jgi:hypothetical protein